MAGRGAERPIFVPHGKRIRVALEGGVILDIENPSPPDTSSYRMTQRSSEREVEQERIKDQFAGAVYEYTKARLDEQGYKLRGREDAGDATLMDAEINLRKSMESARGAGIARGELITVADEWLANVAIPERKMGERTSFVKSIATHLNTMSEEIWELRGVHPLPPRRRRR